VNRKAEVYLFTETEPSLDDWLEFQKTHSYLRIKTAPNNRVLINLSGDTGFEEPRVWASNYLANLRERFEQAGLALIDVGTLHETYRDTRVGKVLWRDAQDRAREIICSCRDDNLTSYDDILQRIDDRF